MYDLITEYITLTTTSGYFNQKREEQNQYWMLETINEQLKSSFYNHPEIVKQLEIVKQQVFNHEVSPFSGAQFLLKTYKIASK